MKHIFNNSDIKSISYNSTAIVNGFINTNEIGQTLNFGNEDPTMPAIVSALLSLAVTNTDHSPSEVASDDPFASNYQGFRGNMNGYSVMFYWINIDNTEDINKVNDLLKFGVDMTPDEWKNAFIFSRNKDKNDICKRYFGTKECSWDIFNPIEPHYEVARYMIYSIISEIRSMFMKYKTLECIYMNDPSSPSNIIIKAERKLQTLTFGNGNKNTIEIFIEAI